MAFPLKAPPPRFLLLVGLLLALATFPEGGEGKSSKLKCVVCSPYGCNETRYGAKFCELGEHCFKQSGNPPNVQIYKGCLDKDTAKCLKENYGSDSCHTLKNYGELTDLVRACPQYWIYASGVSYSYFPTKTGISVCTCNNGHFCNPAGHPTSNKVLTFVILLLSSVIPAVYGGAAGSF